MFYPDSIIPALAPCTSERFDSKSVQKLTIGYFPSSNGNSKRTFVKGDFTQRWNPPDKLEVVNLFCPLLKQQINISMNTDAKHSNDNQMDWII